MTALLRGGLLSSVYSYPKASAEPIGHPIRVFYFSPENQRTLKAHFEERGRASQTR
jgi:hypothetical protein